MPKGEVVGGIANGLVPKRKVKIDDARSVNAFGQPISKTRTGEYDEDVIRQITKAAIRQGVDPYTALGVGMQESGLGSYDNFNAKANFGQVRHDKWDNNPQLQEEIKNNPDLNPEAVAMNFVLKQGLAKKTGNEALDIQDYNGYLLKPNNDIGASKMYGIDLAKYPNGYDLRADPRYGQSVIDLRENVLKKNKSISGIVNGLMPTPENNSLKNVTAAVVPMPSGKIKLQFSRDGKYEKDVEVDAATYNNTQDRGGLLKQLYSGMR